MQARNCATKKCDTIDVVSIFSCLFLAFTTKDVVYPSEKNLAELFERTKHTFIFKELTEFVRFLENTLRSQPHSTKIEQILVDPTGFEPVTSAMQTQRSTN